ncbi:hypothetical protein M378DRAFT_356829 [Amanita muscaria Koide BX008]|uniref:Uncharacterized protein n=1 Tax=Amanita muscaria (strain Koide BX008) TaxID=946122 RepID=A0A0C2SV57_AMAMK|nr:hypothetical protein M378DRAFT_356829 [Amanita muscaria Koide BX008]
MHILLNDDLRTCRKCRRLLHPVEPSKMGEGRGRLKLCKQHMQKIWTHRKILVYPRGLLVQGFNMLQTFRPKASYSPAMS